MENPAAVYEKLIDCVKILYKKAQLVHGDLSEYNIMMCRGKPILFDFSQAVKTEHPLAHEFLKRDIANLTRFFEDLCIKVEPVDRVYRGIVEKYGERAERNYSS